MFGDNLKRIRISHNMSQDELAEKLKVSQKTISSWETNRTEPTMGTVQAIADLFNVSTDELIYNVPQIKLPNSQLVRTIPVYGEISCGTGLFTEDAIIDTISVPVAMLPNKSAEYFAQFVSGDSMIDAGIMPGDLVVFQKTSAIETGMIGCFCIDENIATCKKYSQISGKIYLLPMNDQYSPIPIEPENECFRVVGIKALLISKG